MDHRDHVALIKDGVPKEHTTWAELGSGTGHFTLALAEVLGAQGLIYSVDKDRRALETQRRRIEERIPAARQPQLHTIRADYTRPLELPPLDGILMANSLHYHKHKTRLLADLVRYLVPGGVFVLVEYNTDRGNPWVPHPLSYATWETLAGQVGLAETRLLHRVPSSFLGEFYSAVSVALTA